jgi:hypothetical protein
MPSMLQLIKLVFKVQRGYGRCFCKQSADELNGTIIEPNFTHTGD